MPDFRQKKRLSQMLRKPHLVRAHAAMAVSQNKYLIEQIMDMSQRMITPSLVRALSAEMYRNFEHRLDRLRDDAVIAINEICVLHPAYRKKLNQAIRDANR